MGKIIAIAGPTAVGKTKFAIEIAKRFDGEIISCDSMQLYKYMDIGSAKPTKEELAQVPHHLVDLIDPRDDFSVAQYQKLAKDAIRDVQSRGKLAVISGGTGLYLNRFCMKWTFQKHRKAASIAGCWNSVRKRKAEPLCIKCWKNKIRRPRSVSIPTT